MWEAEYEKKTNRWRKMERRKSWNKKRRKTEEQQHKVVERRKLCLC